jgi:hypothetical protein
MLMWILLTATACPLAIWGAIDHWSARSERRAPKRWPPVTVLSDEASLLAAHAAPTEDSRDQTAQDRPAHAMSAYMIRPRS